MTAEPIESSRKRLGGVIQFHRERRSLTPRRVADMCGVSVEAVGNWEAGHVVPDGKAWDKLKGIVNKRLVSYAELRQRALAEEKEERERIIKSMEHGKMVTNGTNGTPAKQSQRPPAPLAHKPFSGLVDVFPPPESKPDAQSEAVPKKGAMPDRPPGSMKRGAIDERSAWARLQFRARPRMPINGPDGLLEMLRKRFGVGLDPDTCNRIKAEVHEELKLLPPARPAGIDLGPPPIRLKPTAAAVQEAIAAGRIPAPVAQTPAAVTPSSPGIKAAPGPLPGGQLVNTDDIEAAVQLVIGAVAGLRTFSISIDDNGEASVNYTVRETRIHETSGSIKVRR